MTKRISNESRHEELAAAIEEELHKWNYRLIKYEGHYYLGEVWYRKDGSVSSYGSGGLNPLENEDDPTPFTDWLHSDTVEGLKLDYEMLADAFDAVPLVVTGSGLVPEDKLN